MQRAISARIKTWAVRVKVKLRQFHEPKGRIFAHKFFNIMRDLYARN